MISSDLGACEWFVWDLRRSNLIDRGQLDQIIGDFLASQPGAEPHQLAEHLISLGFLTNFQAERLLQGKTQGFVLGPFTLLDALGTGSMGTVYKAQSKNDNRMYAVKVLPRRSMWNVRIARRKVRLFEQVRHPSVVPFIDVGTAGGMHYLAWPMVEGTSVEALVQERGKFTQSETLQLALQAAEGLDSANQAGVFHGLFKPSNLLIGQDGVLRILDYGIGCLLSETEGESLVDTMSTANAVNSGLDCASPESIMDPANLSPIGDQYSLGCVMYFCLTGQYPFPGGTAVEKMMSHQTKKPASIDSFSPGLSPEVIAMVEKLMSKNPADRYPAWQDVILALRNLLETVGSGSAQGTHRRQTMPMPRLNIPVKAAQSSSSSGELTALSPSAQGSSSAPPPTESIPEAPTASRPSSSGSMMTRPVPPLPARIPQPPGKSASGIPRPTAPLGEPSPIRPQSPGSMGGVVPPRPSEQLPARPMPPSGQGGSRPNRPPVLPGAVSGGRAPGPAPVTQMQLPSVPDQSPAASTSPASREPSQARNYTFMIAMIVLAFIVGILFSTLLGRFLPK